MSYHEGPNSNHSPGPGEQFWFLLAIVLLILFGVGWCTPADAEYIPDAPAGAYEIDVEDALKVRLTAVQCLALNIYHEARGEPLRGQYAVGMVTLNRVVSRHYPASVCGVVLQYRQFSWTHDGRSDQPDVDSDEWRLSFNLAYRFIEGGFHVPWQASVTHYHRDDVRVYWPRLRVAFILGRHVFYEPRRS